ncbi:MAG: 2-iminoacetate synthase ThiH [Verrucomicrobiota bacterium]
MAFSSVYAELENGRKRYSSHLLRFEQMLSEETDLELLAKEAQRTTRQYFGKTMRLFAPVYVSNECVNICKYCGFSRNNPILRVTLSTDELERECRYLYEKGFRSILIVAGEHPKFISDSYLKECVETIHPLMSSVSLEVGPMETDQYKPIVEAGAEGLVVYQETYDRALYKEMHVAGPKKDFAWRLDCAERAYEAGFKRLGIGALLGLSDWKKEALALAAHVEHLLKHCWKAFVTVSLPRLKPAAGEFEPLVHVTDRQLTQIYLALRVCFPQIGLVLSTREPQSLRDGLARLGITHMSAGARTEPGGYTGQGQEKLVRREKGKAVSVITAEGGQGACATEQFQISDQRNAEEVAAGLKMMGLDPVWKDWDFGLSQLTDLTKAA